jgi:hypothetical protein
MRRAPTILALTAACALCACSAKPTPALPKETVEGQVQAQGRPVPFVLVAFYPQDPGDANRYDGAADKDGSFSVQCPPGSYKVTITPLPVGVGGNPGAGALAGAHAKGLKEIPAPCRNRTDTPLKVDVPEGGKKGVTLRLQ